MTGTGTGTSPDPVVLLPCDFHGTLTEHVIVESRGFNPRRVCSKCRAAEAAQRALPADWFSAGRGVEPCPHPKDALGCCTGPCAGEDWER